jgi:hypothetical protein
MIQTLISTEHEKHLRSLEKTLNGMLSDDDKDHGIAIRILSPEKGEITVNGQTRGRNGEFSPKASPWELRWQLDFIKKHCLVQGDLVFGEARI